MSGVDVRSLAQAALIVDDLDRAKAFYGGTLGLPHLFDAPPGLAFYQAGATRLMLSRPEGDEAHGGTILYYGVADVSAAYEALSGQGVTFDEPPRRIAEVKGRPIHLAVCRDGVGNHVGLISG
jgi:methylmalonyl-CoA/ethylmalonyl-CoA epimerase